MQSNYVILKTDALATRDVQRGPGTGTRAIVDRVSVQLSALERNQVPLLTRDATVVAVAPAMPMSLIAPVEMNDVDPLAQESTWGVKAVGATTSPLTGEGIVVAVLDTGIDASHPAFVGVELIQQDFTGEGNGDQNGHGTHCAGTIFGRKVNGTRIGVAPGVKKALIGKVLDKNGSGSNAQIVNAILWAADQGAHVISLSLGVDFPAYVQDMVNEGMPLPLATARALEAYRANTRLFDTLSAHVKARGGAHATILVAAAGNESHREIRPDFEVAVSPPAVADGIVSVAALGDTPDGFATARFSNSGANLSAPGVAVVSAALGGGLRPLSGTSMATPHVAGVAALWAQQLANRGMLTAFDLIGKLAGTATSSGLTEGFDPFDVGAGLVQCPQAL